MEKIKYYIEQLSKTKPKKDKVIEYLAEKDDMGDDYKNLIFFYLFPRNLLDMELPSRLMTYRGEEHKVGYSEPNIVETGLLLEAYRTPQYNRYIRHLLHAFHKPEGVFPLKGHGQCECGLCKKAVWAYDDWDKICQDYPENGEREKQKYLAFACDTSRISLCRPCLVQLLTLHQLLTVLEGDKYLDWREKVWDKKVKTRMPGPAGMESDYDV